MTIMPRSRFGGLVRVLGQRVKAMTTKVTARMLTRMRNDGRLAAQPAQWGLSS